MPEAEALLELAGALSITLLGGAEQVLLEPLPGSTPIWSSVRIVGLFEPTSDLTAMQRVMAGLSPQHPSVRRIDDRDWVKLTAGNNVATCFGNRLWVVPKATPGGRPRRQVEIVMPAALAFGTGRHPTTAMCLEWLDQHLREGMRVLDYGCGSGILAIAALKLGASHATAVDIDQQALVATKENAARNNVAANLVVSGDNKATPNGFDIVIANILAKPLVELAPTLLAAATSGGWVVLTGLMWEQADLVRRAYGDGIHHWHQITEDNWLMLSGQRC